MPPRLLVVATASVPAPDLRAAVRAHAGDDAETLIVAHGVAVSALQQGLQTYGGGGSPTDPGAIDGDFGPNTESAAKAYQGERGVGVDGIVGDRTWWVPAGAAGATLASLAGRTTV